ncbi:hypothetical protein EMIT0196MI5_20506 [Pseudomonas sp. IT-196MI5]
MFQLELAEKSGEALNFVMSLLPPSRASSLPHWICVTPQIPVGASLLAMGAFQTPRVFRP